MGAVGNGARFRAGLAALVDVVRSCNQKWLAVIKAGPQPVAQGEWVRRSQALRLAHPAMTLGLARKLRLLPTAAELPAGFRKLATKLPRDVTLS